MQILISKNLHWWISSCLYMLVEKFNWLYSRSNDRTFPLLSLFFSFNWLVQIFFFLPHRRENISIGYEVKWKTNPFRSMIIVEACKNSSIISHIIGPLLGMIVLPSLFDRHIVQLNPPGSVNIERSNIGTRSF
jgi:hypothetical protein